MFISLLPNSLPLGWTYLHFPLASCPHCSAESGLAVPVYWQYYVQPRSVQLIQLALKVTARAQTKTYPQPCFCPADPSPESCTIRIWLSSLLSPSQTQISLSTSWERRSLLVPHHLLFPPLYIFIPAALSPAQLSFIERQCCTSAVGWDASSSYIIFVFSLIRLWV